MKKYIVTWGWEPPQYDKLNNGIVRLFYYTERKTEIIEHTGIDTEDTTTEKVPVWICDVAEYDDIASINKITKGTVKDVALMKLDCFNTSRHVDMFSINGVDVWIDPETRTGLLLRFKSELKTGIEQTTLWHGDLSFTLNVEDAIKMLYAIELYASECYNVTEQHRANIKALTDDEEIREYDYTTGYPPKLQF